MTEPIYKIGDVLSYSDTASTYLILAVKEKSFSGIVYQYKCLRIRECYYNPEYVTLWVSESFFVNACKRVGHIDISLLTGIPDEKPTSGRYKWEEYESFNEWEKQRDEETVGDVFNTLTEKQRSAAYALIGQALDSKKKDVDALRLENEKLKNEIQAMKDELKEMKDKLDREEHKIAIWKNGWYDCLKSLGYYLNS